MEAMNEKTRAGASLPIFEETLRSMNKLNIRRDEIGRWTHVEVEQGWYQSLSGQLYHYDGMVWDVVPAERIEDLEFLG